MDLENRLPASNSNRMKLIEILFEHACFFQILYYLRHSKKMAAQFTSFITTSGRFTTASASIITIITTR
jgi:hypothetical protein